VRGVETVVVDCKLCLHSERVTRQLCTLYPKPLKLKPES